jgi:2-polyprenyl-3-methyl-5-hydroxy-6-metoxy-1,4-benzoquinol methylase
LNVSSNVAFPTAILFLAKVGCQTMTLQVDRNHYNNNYDTKERFCSYWHQINEVISLKPKSILEIGTGNRFVSTYLCERGFNVTSLDIDKKLKPTVCGSILNVPFKDQAFDLITCYQVLEHLPYTAFKKALSELSRVSRLYVLLSIPDASRYGRLFLQAPLIGTFQKLIQLPTIKKIVHIMDGQHYWEIGKESYNLKKIAFDINKTGFIIENTYRVFEMPYHRFFKLQKAVSEHIDVNDVQLDLK